MLPVLDMKVFACTSEIFWSILQEPDFQENEYMYDDFDLEENLAACKWFVTL